MRKEEFASSVSRRNFLKGSLAAGAAVSVVAATGCAKPEPVVDAPGTDVPPALAPTPDPAPVLLDQPVIPATFKYDFFKPFEGEVAFVEGPIADSDIASIVECDVVVCGAGLAGVSCAFSSVENGLKTVLLEKSAMVQGRGAQVAGIGSNLQKQAGSAEIDITEYVDDAMQSAGYRCDRSVWERFATRSGEACDWFANLVGDAAGPWIVDGMVHKKNAGIISWGDTLMPATAMASVPPVFMEKLPGSGIDVRFNTPAVQLVKDASGKITGVIAREQDGKLVKFKAAKGVVLATGGYENNWDMLCRFVEPRNLAVATWRNPTTTNTGDGHLMGLAVGAAMDDYPHVMMNDPGASVKSHSFNRPLSQAFLRVNEEGKRFMNEAISPEYAANAIARQTGAHCYAIIGGDLLTNLQEFFGKLRLRWTAEEMTPQLEPELIKADTLEELAQKCGIDIDNLKATIEQNNKNYDAQVDFEFGKDPNCLLAIREAPYYACEEGAAALVSVSGLKINADSQVLDEGGKVIEGLYALGNVSGSMYSAYYPHHLQGNSHGRCVTFGYLVGRQLAGLE